MSDEPMEFVAPVREELRALIVHLREAGNTQVVEIDNTIEISRFGL